MAVTMTYVKEVLKNPEQFEMLETPAIAEIAETLAKSEAKDKEKMVAKFAKLIKERSEIAPKEEVAELVTIENSVKVVKKATAVNAEAEATAETKAPKFRPKNAETKAPVEETKAETVAEEPKVTAQDLDTADNKGLRAIAVKYGIKVPAVISTVNLRKKLKMEIIGYVEEEAKPADKAPKADAKKDDKKADAKAVENPFPAEMDGFVRIELAELQTAIVEHVYQVACYIQEPGNTSYTTFMVTYANDEVVVLLDVSDQVNSVIPFNMKSFEGITVKLDGKKCPVAFYAPKA